MKALALFILLFVSAPIVSAQPIVVIVRHAEKAANGGNDPDLSSAGRARAEALARILKDSGITAIFTSEFKRTQETAVPTATSAHVTPTVGCGQRHGDARRKIASVRRQRTGYWAWRHNSEHRQSAWNQGLDQHS